MPDQKEKPIVVRYTMCHNGEEKEYNYSRLASADKRFISMCNDMVSYKRIVGFNHVSTVTLLEGDVVLRTKTEDCIHQIRATA